MLLVNLMIQLVSGIIGGNAASGAFSRAASGIAGNSVLGALGGLCCAQLLSPGRLVSGSLDLASMAVQIVVCILGGGALVLVTGAFRTSRRPGGQVR
jgi:uncharacterized membrane protein YeaQ/YmgE (transglycosylase-associated protein family)